ncbi:hypothetical protein QUC31_007566 [Theobroma cacao]
MIPKTERHGLTGKCSYVQFNIPSLIWSLLLRSIYPNSTARLKRCIKDGRFGRLCISSNFGQNFG